MSFHQTFVHYTPFKPIQHLHDFNIKIFLPIIIFDDNRPIINLAINKNNSIQSKHIYTRYRCIKEIIQNGFITLGYVPSDEQIVDLLTKSQGRIKFV